MASFDQIVALTDFVPQTKAASSEVDANFALMRDEFNKLVTGANTINVNTINEVSSAVGVTIDSVVLKDGGATLTADLSVGADLLLTGTPQLFLNETAHGQQVIGITLNQGPNDDIAVALKSSDIATVLTTIVTGTVETDDYMTLGKANAAEGGVLLQSLAENAAVSPVLILESYGGTATTTKSTAGRALVEIYVAEHDGANALANITADGNVFAVRARRGGSDVALWILDEDGDGWLGGSLTVTNIVTSVASTMVGDLSLDGDLDFVGAQAITTSAGDLSLTPTANLILAPLKNFINDSANAKQVIGITINQGASDDEATAWKSSDVSHAVTDVAEGDTFGTAKKMSASQGGLLFTGFIDTGTKAIEIRGVAISDNTTKSSSGTAPVVLNAQLISSNTTGSVGSNANIAVFQNDGSTRLLIDEDGDIHSISGAAPAAFDDEEDALVLRAYSLARSSHGGVIRSTWDRFVKYAEPDLIRLGILGAPIREGGLTNITQLVRFLTGDSWQSYVERRVMRRQLKSQQRQNRTLRAEMKEIRHLLKAA